VLHRSIQRIKDLQKGNDPAELINIAEEQPEKVKEMAKIYFSESKDFPPPVTWKKEK